MERSMLIVGAEHRAAHVREHFHRLGHTVPWSRWTGRRRGLCFALERTSTLEPPDPSFLMAVLAQLPFRARIPADLQEALVGPVSGLAEELSRALELDVLVVHRSATHQVLVVWADGTVLDILLLDGSTRWTATERVPQGGAEAWRAEVDRLLAGPLSRTPRGGDIADFVQGAVVGEVIGWDPSKVLAQVLALAGFAAVLGWTFIGKKIGDGFGHGDLGGTLGFFSAIAIGLGVAAWTGAISFPARSKVGAIGLAGLVLLGVARGLAGSPGAVWFGGTGLLVLVIAAILGAFQLAAARPKVEVDTLPDD